MPALIPSVVVPIYNAKQALVECLESLRRYVSDSVNVWLADDASTDPSIEQISRAWVSRRGESTTHYLRHARNLGFVGNVNCSVRLAGATDVILLNSDTLVGPDFVERLQECAERDSRIATITPWSNNAEICSFPDFCKPNPMPKLDDMARISCAALTLAAVPPIDLPTAVGFAMWIRREAWERLGGFDEATFGKGYGEENDFSVRAARHGWRNVLCPSAYVAHRGHASFSETGLAPGGENLNRLVARYPHYNESIADFIRADPLAPAREQLRASLQKL